MQGRAFSLIGRSDPAFRLRVVHVGSGVTVGLGAAGAVYSLMTWSEPHRPVLLLVSLTAAIDGVVIAVLRRRIARSRLVEPFFLGWNLSHVLAAGLLCYLDGGPTSPFVTVLFVSN